MLVDVLAGRDRLRGDPDRLPVLEHLLARGDVDEGDLVAVGNRVADGHAAPGALELGARLELAAGERHRVSGVKLEQCAGEIHGQPPFCTHACAGSRCGIITRPSPAMTHR